jgi:hypothetical protein
MRDSQPSGTRSCERGVGDDAALRITHVIPAALIIAEIAAQLPSQRVRGTAA